MEPKVILVDYLDNPLGEMKKGAAHASPHLHLSLIHISEPTRH